MDHLNNPEHDRLYVHVDATAKRLAAIARVWAEDACQAGNIDKADMLYAAGKLLETEGVRWALRDMARARGWR